MSISLRAVFLVLLLYCAGLAAAAQFAKIAVPFEHVQALFEGRGAELGWLLSLISLMGALFGIIAGGLVGRIGLKALLLAGLVLGGLVSLWQAMLPGFTVLLLSRVIEGFAHLAIVVAAPTLITQIAGDRMQGFAMTLWSTFFGVSFALVAWLALPWVSTNGLPALWHWHGIAMLALALLLAAGLSGQQIAGAMGTSISVAQMLRNQVDAYRSASIAAPGVGWLFYTLTFVSALAILPQQMPGDTALWVAGLMPLVSIASAMLLNPLLLRSISSIAIVMIGFAASLAVVLLAAMGLPLAAAGIALFTVLGLVQGASFSAIPELTSTVESRALAYGVMAQTGNIGNLTGTPILLFVLQMGGLKAMFLVMAGFYLLALAAHLLLARRRQLSAGSPTNG